MVHGLETLERLNREAIERARAGDRSKAATDRLVMDMPEGLLGLRHICDDVATRFATDCVQVNFQTGKLEATDGRIAVQNPFNVPDEFAALPPLMIHHSVLEAVEKNIEGAYRLKLVREANGDWFVQDIATRFAVPECSHKFPKLEQVFAATSSDANLRFKLNIEFLKRLQLAFGEYRDNHGELVWRFEVPIGGGVASISGPDCAFHSRVHLYGESPQAFIHRPLNNWRKATAEDCGRLARFKNRGETGWAYGLLVACESHEFHCKWSDNNEIVSQFEVCEVEQ